jgi:hypothetical protein
MSARSWPHNNAMLLTPASASPPSAACLGARASAAPRGRSKSLGPLGCVKWLRRWHRRAPAVAPTSAFERQRLAKKPSVWEQALRRWCRSNGWPLMVRWAQTAALLPRAVILECRAASAYLNVLQTNCRRAQKSVPLSNGKAGVQHFTAVDGHEQRFVGSRNPVDEA